MPKTEAHTRPDLSSLELETRVNIVLAEVVDGAVWTRTEQYAGQTLEWMLSVPAAWGLQGVGYLLVTGEFIAVTSFFRDYLDDPAAAWSLMVRELWGCERATSGGWRGHYLTSPTRASIGPEAPSLERAVALAALHKHAAGRFADLICPLLQEVERA